ncbi:UNVERIFIED_CONTAM: hypothetical protein K2H54_046571 [Gekko kuhli]
MPNKTRSGGVRCWPLRANARCFSSNFVKSEHARIPVARRKWKLRVFPAQRERLVPDAMLKLTVGPIPLGLARKNNLPSQRVSRPSLCRRSVKQDRRKSLPPLHADVTELSKAISLDLPEKDRMVQLLLSSFQYAAQKFKDTLKHTEGFNAEAFERKVNEISEELRFCTKRLDLDGTLQKCFEEPKGDSSDPVLNASLTTLKENIARLSEENQAWDQLLWSYQRRAEEISSQLQQCKLRVAPEEPVSYLGSSQAHVLQAKPDYQKILDSQGKLFDSMELVVSNRGRNES